ncbi:MAG: hypothetical protein WBN96_04835 [Gammaproteobacteria bacterium]
MINLKRIHYIAAVFTCCQSFTVFSGDDTFVEIDASLGLDDNVTRADVDADIEYDTFVSVAANFGHEAWRGEGGQLVLNASIETEQFFDFSGLTNYSASAAATYTFGFSSGFGAPWFALNAKYRVTEFDSELRDSDFAFLNATMGKRIDDRTDMRIGIGAQSRDSDGRAFDNDNTFGFINFDFNVAPKRTVYLTYRLQKGDTFSTASPANISLAVLNEAGLANEADDVFTGKRTYRLDATTHLVTIGYNRALDLESAYDISARYLTSETDVDLDYQVLMVRVSYFRRFGLDL